MKLTLSDKLSVDPILEGLGVLKEQKDLIYKSVFKKE